MQLATGGSMLNFGFWSKNHPDPISAQNNLCMIFANMAELSSTTTVGLASGDIELSLQEKSTNKTNKLKLFKHFFISLTPFKVFLSYPNIQNK